MVKSPSQIRAEYIRRYIQEEIYCKHNQDPNVFVDVSSGMLSLWCNKDFKNIQLASLSADDPSVVQYHRPNFDTEQVVPSFRLVLNACNHFEHMREVAKLPSD